jgi:nanoRNase/pAp phosphatase (c-di-AMP/oligoRNAs hydrolase)
VETIDVRTDELLGVLARYKGKRLFTAVLGSPDPDGLASAWALKLLARHAGATMDILTFEVVSRPDNVAFVQQLAIPFRQVSGRLPRLGYAAYAVVDRQNARLPVPVPRGIELIAHIDHHSPIPTGSIFCQQETGFGSTASIMALHLARLARETRLDAGELCRVSTALMYGIRTDTSDFLTAKSIDFEAAARIAPFASAELTRSIVLTPLGRPFLETLATALASGISRNGFTVAYAGRVGRRARDTIGQTADFMIRAEGTRAVVVFGMVNNSFVGSLRASQPELDPYVFLDDSLSGKLGFPVDCGGRTFAGGFQVQLAGALGGDEEQGREKIVAALLEGWARITTRTRSKTATVPRRKSPAKPKVKSSSPPKD